MSTGGQTLDTSISDINNVTNIYIDDLQKYLSHNSVFYLVSYALDTTICSIDYLFITLLHFTVSVLKSSSSATQVIN